MGLENFWQIDEETPGWIEGDFLVCYGPFSNKGNSSFRGRAYDDIIESLTGVSLYEDKIDTDTILKMNEKIQECLVEKARELAGYDLKVEEWKDFQKMWDCHAKAGHYLISWC